MKDHEKDVLDDLRHALAVTPSPDFEARVRRDVESRRRPLWLPTRSWRWQIAAAIALATGLTFLMRDVPPQRPKTAQQPLGEEKTRARAPSDVTSESVPTGEVARGTGPTPIRNSGRMARTVRREPTPAIARSAAPPEIVDAAGPDLTVVTNQPELLRRLRERAARSTGVAAELPAPPGPSAFAELESAPAIVVRAVVVAPIEFDEGE